MTCDEVREYWFERDLADSAGVSQASDDAQNHRSSCPACALWLERQNTFDGMVTEAMLVAPPPDLVARLALIPATMARLNPVEADPGAATEPTFTSLAIEAVFLASVGLAAIAFGGIDPLANAELAVAWLGNLLQVIPLLLTSPLIPYLQELAFTTVSALATLVLLGLSVNQLGPDSFGPQRSREVGGA